MPCRIALDMDIEERIIRLLNDAKLTPFELIESLDGEYTRCPDDLIRTLNKMRKKGLIHGEFSEERSAWLYWINK